jgi:hypothetical protein
MPYLRILGFALGLSTHAQLLGASRSGLSKTTFSLRFAVVTPFYQQVHDAGECAF